LAGTGAACLRGCLPRPSRGRSEPAPLQDVGVGEELDGEAGEEEDAEAAVVDVVYGLTTTPEWVRW
jgi:hypothetical protein